MVQMRNVQPATTILESKCTRSFENVDDDVSSDVSDCDFAQMRSETEPCHGSAEFDFPAQAPKAPEVRPRWAIEKPQAQTPHVRHVALPRDEDWPVSPSEQAPHTAMLPESGLYFPTYGDVATPMMPPLYHMDGFATPYDSPVPSPPQPLQPVGYYVMQPESQRLPPPTTYNHSAPMPAPAPVYYHHTPYGDYQHAPYGAEAQPYPEHPDTTGPLQASSESYESFEHCDSVSHEGSELDVAAPALQETKAAAVKAAAKQRKGRRGGANARTMDLDDYTIIPAGQQRRRRPRRGHNGNAKADKPASDRWAGLKA
eukprot:TRINITY_DN2859_c0_g1_i1.p1 TRINITY_DN2859_c0_g1~~TRINITY_DN2859_c0_g1_i1.p1  ORF type:complete len:313 (+),score=121.82 TRINITY_DN2859_c0_g1_i1:82-1020(+)